MTELRQRMDDAMVLRGFALRTRETYLACVSALAKHYRCSPERLNAQQIQAYLLYLIRERKLAYAPAVRGVRITIIDDGAGGRQNRIRVCHIKHDPPRRQPLHLRAAERYCGPCAPRFERTLCDPRYATQLTTRYAVLQSP